MLVKPAEKTEIHHFVGNELGVDMTDSELEAILAAYDQSKLQNSYLFLMRELSKLINTRAEIGATTHGHSAVDVPLITFGNNIHLQGIMENTEMSQKLWTKYYKFDFNYYKSLLKNQNVKDPFGRVPIPEKRHCAY